MKFCFVCGKKIENLIKGYCEECYNKKFKLIEVPQKIEVTVCKKCDNIKVGNLWKNIEIDEFLRKKAKILGKNIKIKFEINDIIKIRAKGFLEGSKKPKEEVHEVKLKISKKTCDECSKRSRKYYEAIIQIRGGLTGDDVDSIDSIVLTEKAFYRIEEVKGGYDLFISNKSLADKITDFFRKKYKIQTKRSYKLVTSRNGKNIYKNIILIRILSV